MKMLEIYTHQEIFYFISNFDWSEKILWFLTFIFIPLTGNIFTGGVS